MIKCLCINDSNKPTQIPNEKWLQKGTEYTLLFSMTVLPQKQLSFFSWCLFISKKLN